MRNFDEVRVARATRKVEERTFTLGGETFVLRPSVRPDAIMQAGSTEGKEPIVLLADIDNAIVTSIEPGPKVTVPDPGKGDEATREVGEAVARYEELRAREDDPISLTDLLDVVQWVVETQTGRPTQPPSASSNGQTGTETTSTVVSSSPAIPAA